MEISEVQDFLLAEKDHDDDAAIVKYFTFNL